MILVLVPIFLSACSSSDRECGGEVALSPPPKVTLTATDVSGNKLTAYVISYQTSSRSGSKTIYCNSTDACDLEFFGEGEIAITVSKVGYESVSLKTSIQVIDGCGHTNVERLSVKLKQLV
jgi:hypothetical protein